MRLVVADASTLVALLLDSGPDGQWATHALVGAAIAAPALVRFEAANVIGRQALADIVTADQAAQAHGDLLALEIEEWPYEVFLRGSGSCDETCRATTRATSPSPST